jgi:hypothetical protein
MNAAQAFEDLRVALDDCLPELPQVRNRILESSLQRLRDPRVPWRDWVVLRELVLRWRCHSRFDGASTHFLFVFPTSSASAREMLDAEVIVRVRAVPNGEASLPAPTDPAEVALTFPRLIALRTTPEQFAAWTPTGAEPARTVILRLGPSETLGLWAPVAGNDPPDKFFPGRIRARWIRPSAESLHGPMGAWPVKLVVSLARALASSEAAQPADAARVGELDLSRAIWKLALSALQTAANVHAMLPPGAGPSAEPLDALRYDSSLASFSLRAGALVDWRGAVVDADADDTFVAPFRAEWSEDEPNEPLALRIEPPDVAASGELREQLLGAFAETDKVRGLTKSFNEATGAHLKEEDVAAWCRPAADQAIALRVDRVTRGVLIKKKFDEYLLVLTGIAAEQEVAAIVYAEYVQLAFENGHVRVTALDGLRVLYSGKLDDSLLAWGDGAKKPNARLFGDLMVLLLRWRALLR